MVEGWRNTWRDLPNFESATTSTPVSRWIRSRSRSQASDVRIPVTVSRPISVCQVAARNGGLSRPAALISAVISPGEYR